MENVVHKKCIYEFLGYSGEEVAASLFISPRTVRRYVSICRNTGNVHAQKLGRPRNSFAMHPHVEYIIMEAILENPAKTLAEISYDVYQQTGFERATSSVLLYLKRNRFTHKKVCQSCLLYIIHYFQLYRYLTFNLYNKLAKIALQRSEETRILYRADICLLAPEMLVFLDESGFVSYLNVCWNAFNFTLLPQRIAVFVL